MQHAKSTDSPSPQTTDAYTYTDALTYPEPRTLRVEPLDPTIPHLHYLTVEASFLLMGWDDAVELYDWLGAWIDAHAPEHDGEAGR